MPRFANNHTRTGTLGKFSKKGAICGKVISPTVFQDERLRKINFQFFVGDKGRACQNYRVPGVTAQAMQQVLPNGEILFIFHDSGKMNLKEVCDWLNEHVKPALKSDAGFDIDFTEDNCFDIGDQQFEGGRRHIYAWSLESAEKPETDEEVDEDDEPISVYDLDYSPDESDDGDEEEEVAENWNPDDSANDLNDMLATDYEQEIADQTPQFFSPGEIWNKIKESCKDEKDFQRVADYAIEFEECVNVTGRNGEESVQEPEEVDFDGVMKSWNKKTLREFVEFAYDKGVVLDQVELNLRGVEGITDWDFERNDAKRTIVITVSTEADVADYMNESEDEIKPEDVEKSVESCKESLKKIWKKCCAEADEETADELKDLYDAMTFECDEDDEIQSDDPKTECQNLLKRIYECVAGLRECCCIGCRKCCCDRVDPRVEIRPLTVQDVAVALNKIVDGDYGISYESEEPEDYETDSGACDEDELDDPDEKMRKAVEACMAKKSGLRTGMMEDDDEEVQASDSDESEDSDDEEQVCESIASWADAAKNGLVVD